MCTTSSWYNHMVCKLIYLLLYSPDYNPIEQGFSTIKTFLRCQEYYTWQSGEVFSNIRISCVAHLVLSFVDVSVVLCMFSLYMSWYYLSKSEEQQHKGSKKILPNVHWTQSLLPSIPGNIFSNQACLVLSAKFMKITTCFSFATSSLSLSVRFLCISSNLMAWANGSPTISSSHHWRLLIHQCHWMHPLPSLDPPPPYLMLDQ